MRLKSKFESWRNGEQFSDPISPAGVLHILSTLRPGFAVGAGRSLCREPSTPEAGLTLPLVNPPIERGLLSNSFLGLLAVARQLGTISGRQKKFRTRTTQKEDTTRDDKTKEEILP